MNQTVALKQLHGGSKSIPPDQTARAAFSRHFAYDRKDWAALWNRQLGLDGRAAAAPEE